MLLRFAVVLAAALPTSPSFGICLRPEPEGSGETAEPVLAGEDGVACTVRAIETHLAGRR
jgi:hypothetical protein